MIDLSILLQDLLLVSISALLSLAPNSLRNIFCRAQNFEKCPIFDFSDNYHDRALKLV